MVLLTAIVVLALALRVVWLSVTDTVPPALTDPQYYSATAQNIAEGRGYSVAVDERGFVAAPAGEPTAFWSPGYAFALAPLYWLTDSDERAGKALNAVAGALTVLPIFYIGRRLDPSEGDTDVRSRSAGERVGLLAALLFALSPSLVFWTSSLFSETLFTFFVASTLAVAIWAGERRSMSAYFATGLLLAATALVRSQGLVLAAPVLVALIAPVVADGRAAAAGLRAGAWSLLAVSVRPALAMIAGIALLLAPWTARNQIAMGRPYLINDNMGYNLRLAHAPYARGTSVPPQDLWDERPGISFKEREIFFDDEGRKRALSYIRHHPGREVELAALRIGWLLRSDAEVSIRFAESLGVTRLDFDRDAMVLLGDLYWYPLLALAATSLFVAGRRNPVFVVLWSTVGAWLALHLVFAGEPRYHVPLMPVLAVLAAASLVGRGPSAQNQAPRT
jgi:hypothetical protein